MNLDELVKQEMLKQMASLSEKINSTIQGVTESVLNEKVDRYGNVPTYASDAKYTRLEYMARKAVIGMTETSLRNAIHSASQEQKIPVIDFGPVAKLVNERLQSKAQEILEGLHFNVGINGEF
jgi:UTP-glucose-1-phosphate uridylyltransferase